MGGFLSTYLHFVDGYSVSLLPVDMFNFVGTSSEVKFEILQQEAFWMFEGSLE